MTKVLLPYCFLVVTLLAAACLVYRDPPPLEPPPTSAPDPLIALGQTRFMAYKCHECHGPHGEGTDDAPDLTGTRLDAAAIALFLQKPSAHARSVGMPSIPADSPDLQPLVAFVLSLKRPPAVRYSRQQLTHARDLVERRSFRPLPHSRYTF